MIDPNNIYIGDSTELLKQVNSESIQLVLTDPPWNVSDPNKHVSAPGNKREFLYNFGDWDLFESDKEYLQFIKNNVNEIYRILKPEGSFVSFFPEWNICYLKMIWERLGGTTRQKLYVQKTNPKPRLRKVDFQRSIDELYWGTKSKSGHIFNYQIGQQKNFVSVPVYVQKEHTKYPTQKVLASVLWIIKYLSSKDDIVLDPFMGSGTFIEGAILLGRKFIGFDNNEESIKITKERIDKRIKQSKL